MSEAQTTFLNVACGHSAPIVDTHLHYISECEARWHGPALRDARSNWTAFEELKPVLTEALLAYHRDTQLEDVTGRLHNPDGTLTSYLWKFQDTLQSDKSCLHPLLDFEEHYQKVFLRRGLLIYCAMILRGFE